MRKKAKNGGVLSSMWVFAGEPGLARAGEWLVQDHHEMRGYATIGPEICGRGVPWMSLSQGNLAPAFAAAELATLESG